MENFGFGIGILLAIFGPLLLIPVVWIVHRWIAWPIVFHVMSPATSKIVVRWIALVSALLVVAATMSLSYFPGKLEFDRLCAQHAIPVVSEKVATPGFYRTRLYPYEARKYLGNDSFQFVESPHMYKKEVYIRYSRTDTDRIHEQEVSELKSLYGVREDFSHRRYGILMTEKVVYEIESNRELARAAQVIYEGGPLSLFLGVYGMSSCPDVRSTEGSHYFQTFYDLESITLRAPSHGS